jgi:hypothetical protein
MRKKQHRPAVDGLAEARAIPERILLFDDELSMLFAARVVWRNQLELGIRFEREWDVTDRTRIARLLSGRYYALPVA